MFFSRIRERSVIQIGGDTDSTCFRTSKGTINVNVVDLTHISNRKCDVQQVEHRGTDKEA